MAMSVEVTRSREQYATVAHRRILEELQLEAVQHAAQHSLRRQPLGQHGRHGARSADTGLEPVDEGVRRIRQQLNEIAARHADRLVAADEHTERTGRRRLLALGKVCRHIIADLAGDERDGADIGFLHLQVADDREHTVRCRRQRRHPACPHTSPAA